MSAEQPTEAERVAALHRVAAADYAAGKDPARREAARNQLADAREHAAVSAGAWRSTY
ncbi:hypothetical protein ACFWR6_19535 [Streptomyces griseus]|uniref:hypothetical protein n=1 Tax=Streptomyces griseus TaxID=1911 RepID=UPI00365C9A55